MNIATEDIFFTKGTEQIPPIYREAFYRDVKQALNVKTGVSVWRHANAKCGTSAKEQAKLDRIFKKYGVINWRGKARKRTKVTA